jgi:hypothetical protein
MWSRNERGVLAWLRLADTLNKAKWQTWPGVDGDKRPVGKENNYRGNCGQAAGRRFADQVDGCLLQLIHHILLQSQ